MSATRRAVAAGAVALIAGPAPAPALARARPRRPGRIVSLNNCLDALLVALADREQIAALSHYARQPQGSTIVEAARTLPYTHETAEEVVALRPDLVLLGQYGARATRNALARLDVPVAAFSTPQSVAESLAQVAEVSRRIGHADRGARLARAIRAAVADSAPPPGAPRLSALVFQPNGFAAGPGSLMDEMMAHAGFDNAARRYGLGRWGNVPLERLLADPPQVLLSGDPAPGARSWADRIMTHPALASLAGRTHRARLPERLIYCAGPVLIQTAATLKAAHRSAREALS